MLPLQLTIINIVRSLLEFFFLSMENFVLFYVHFKNVLSKKLYISVFFFFVIPAINPYHPRRNQSSSGVL